MSQPNAPVRVYRNVAEGVVQTLAEIFERQRVAERAVDYAFRTHPKWGSRDRSFFADAVYEIVRWQRLLAWTVEREDYWALLGAYLVRRGAELPPWEEFAGINPEIIRQRLVADTAPLAIRQSIPDWLTALPRPDWADRWPAELTAQNGPAPVTLRVNTLKTTPEEAAARLQAEGIETEPVPGVPMALRLKERRPITRTAAYLSGLVEVQDAGSQLIVPALRLEPGMHVIDACAGAGGKTLQIAALLRNRGHIRALDVGEERLAELRRRMERAGATGIRTAVIDDGIRNNLRGWADRLLLDVPCSGTGTLRRQPDLKWRLTPEFIADINQIQRQLLRDFPAMVKPGGLVVYATCSLLPLEGEDVVRDRLATSTDLELLEEHRVWTSDSGFDGFYFAVLRKVR